MGFTRARRYANYKGGKKYAGAVPKDKKGQSGSHGRAQNERQAEDANKAESAAIFKNWLHLAKNNREYNRLGKNFRSDYP